MISAAEAQLVGCPLPAAVVERTESIRMRVALSRNISRSIRIAWVVATAVI
jgi:hypothetical protein